MISSDVAAAAFPHAPATRLVRDGIARSAVIRTRLAKQVVALPSARSRVEVWDDKHGEVQAVSGCDGGDGRGCDGCDGDGDGGCTATADLMHGAATGDRQAWEELVGRYTGMLYAIARSYGLDPATSGDAVQTTWLRLVEHLGTLREPSAVGGWLATTVRRQCLVLVRNRRRELPVEQAEELYPPDTDHSPENEVAARDRDAQVRAAFHRLPVKDRRLLACLMVSAPLQLCRRVRQA